MTTATAARLDNVRAMMCDLMGDHDWLTVSLEGLEKWLDMGPSWEPTTTTTRELCEELISNSVEPCHCT